MSADDGPEMVKQVSALPFRKLFKNIGTDEIAYIQGKLWGQNTKKILFIYMDLLRFIIENYFI